ncbi:hypothetical protein SLS55_008355 [Diplodia seriata]|uniref:Uncharacterized protein n=1 Tax=Diplodia seriata TaxID=420778 RepID=A0ABR3CCQ9_9PEZI
MAAQRTSQNALSNDSDDTQPPFWTPRAPKANDTHARWKIRSPRGTIVKRENQKGKQKTSTQDQAEKYRQWVLYDTDINISKTCLPPPYTILSDRVMGRMAEWLKTTQGARFSGVGR